MGPQSRKRLRRCGYLSLFFPALYLIVVPVSSVAQASASDSAKPTLLNAEQDHQRLMDLLHIASLRPGPSGDPKAADAANVDESKVPAYALPDPLVLKNGKRVRDAQTWWHVRRPEIVEDFDCEVYGREPKDTPKVNWELVSTTRGEKDGVAIITKELLGHVDDSAFPEIKVDIELSVTTPAKAGGPVPVMLELGWSAKMLKALRSRFTAEQWADFVGKGPGDLPVDAHELIALCAPRPVFISSGAPPKEPGWIDAKGMFLGAVGAGPVYKLLGKEDLGSTEFPAVETALISGEIAFRQHAGGHTAGPNWVTFLEFASRYIKGQDAAR